MQDRSTSTRRPPLRAIREARGLTLRQVGDQAGIDIGHLSRIERGQARVSLEKLARLAAVLGLTELERHLSLYTREPDLSRAQDSCDDGNANGNVT